VELILSSIIDMYRCDFSKYSLLMGQNFGIWGSLESTAPKGEKMSGTDMYHHAPSPRYLSPHKKT